MSHSIFHHQHAQHPQTEGLVIHWATRYDLLVPFFTFGGSRRLYRRLVDLMQVKPGDAVLDVGCGPGDLALVLAERVGAGGLAAGIDPSPEMIARARQKAQRRQASVDFRVEPVEALSFPDQRFDKVVSTFAFHHLRGDLKRQALATIARVLKPGGQVYIVDFMPLPGKQRGVMGSDAQLLLDLLRDAGFTDIASSRQLPSLGFLMSLRRVPPACLISARTPG